MFYTERRKTKFFKRFVSVYALIACVALAFVGGLECGQGQIS